MLNVNYLKLRVKTCKNIIMQFYSFIINLYPHISICFNSNLSNHLISLIVIKRSLIRIILLIVIPYKSRLFEYNFKTISYFPANKSFNTRLELYNIHSWQIYVYLYFYRS